MDECLDQDEAVFRSVSKGVGNRSVELALSGKFLINCYEHVDDFD